uniref:Phosphatase n=1 Tax=Glycine max TaxID=3847 RepID=C6SZJ9_SOYBN|nr:unknown [Glycine max]
MGGGGVVVVLDFDRTIIDDDSDRWIVAELGLTELFKELRHSMPWISLMDRIMAQLHSNGVTVDHIADCLKRLPFPPPIVSAIKSAHALGCDLRIISDTNTFSIRTILQHHALFHCFSQIHTNPAFLDNQGRLRVTPFHHSTHSPHSCPLCPPNMCKGLVIDQIRSSLLSGTGNEEERRFIYIGDGAGDYCPTLKLKGGDFVMPRKNYPLWNKIHSDPKLVAAQLHDWSTGEDLETILLNLINKISL